MSEYKPDEEMLKKIAEGIPDEVKSALRIQQLIENRPEYQLHLKKLDDADGMNLNIITADSKAPIGCMFHAIIVLLQAINENANFTADELTFFFYDFIHFMKEEYSKKEESEE